MIHAWLVQLSNQVMQVNTRLCIAPHLQCMPQQQLLLPAQHPRKVHNEAHMQRTAPPRSIPKHRHALIRQQQLTARRYNVIFSDRQLQ
jgi:hypothetical protein